MFDIIYTGGSICSLIDAMSKDKSKKILVIEKNILGGAWYIKSNELCNNFETAGHMIVPENNYIGKKIINYFDKYNCKFNKILKKDFKFDNEDYKGNNKEGDPLVPEDTWADFYFSVKNRLNQYQNIRFFQDEIINIKVEKDYNTIFCQKEELKCKKIVITSYSKIEKINYFEKDIFLPYECIKNKHVLLYINTCKILISKNFQYFVDQNIIIDRISVAALKKDDYKYTKITSNDVNIIIICRISKNFKMLPFDITGILYLKELIKLKILVDDSNIIKCEKYSYECCYRRENKILEDTDIEKIQYLNTRYMGHFLKNYL